MRFFKIIKDINCQADIKNLKQCIFKNFKNYYGKN